MEGVSGTLAALARIAPDLATASAPAAGRSHRNFEGHSGAGASLVTGQRDLSAQAIASDLRFDEGMPHPFDFVAHCGKIDRDFVGERAIDVSIERGRSVNGNPTIVNAPVVLHACP